MTRNIAKSNAQTPKDLWQTPSKLFQALNEYFEFTVDAAANEQNNLVERFWSEEDSCLNHDWHGEVVFCNPPFSQLSRDDRWIQKFTEMTQGLIVMPMATDTKWFHSMASIPHKLFIFKGRIKYEHPTTKSQSPTFPSGLFIKGLEKPDEFASHMKERGFSGIVYQKTC